MPRAVRPRLYGRPAPARAVAGVRTVTDSGRHFVSARDWLGAEGAEPAATAERRAEQLVQRNGDTLRELGITADVVRRSGEPGLQLLTSSRVGAVPLVSPGTGRHDFGLMVQPRFAWSCAGDVLAGTGFRVVPNLLRLPELPQSERRIPPWVLSSIVLRRMQALLAAMQRRFVMAEADLHAPRGQVDWTTYAVARMTSGHMLSVPCRFPDLRDDEEMRSAVHWVVRQHRDALLGQSSAGRVVRALLEQCDELLARVVGTTPRRPTQAVRDGWSRRAVAPHALREGTQAIDWTVDGRGLAGPSDLAGLAWRLDMDTFFEAWVEAVAEQVALRTGARVRAGRTSATRVPLDWQPTGAGSQRSLLPDVVLERPDVVVVIDAKHKRHAEDIERLGWTNASDELREQHRHDLLQALAYSTLFDAPRVIACLAYPAEPNAWRRLDARNRAMTRARVRGGEREVELALMAVPLSGDREEAGRSLQRLLRTAVD